MSPACPSSAGSAAPSASFHSRTFPESPTAATNASSALIATAFGLGIAITALLPFNFLNARTEQARHELESASTQLELLVGIRGEGGATNGQSRAHPDPHRERERELHGRRQFLQKQMEELERELYGHQFRLEQPVKE